jgi:hypothetical protein
LLALASAATGFAPLVTGLGNVRGKTHDHKKVNKHTDYRCSTSLGGIRVTVCGKDDQINGGERQNLVKSYSGGNE